MKTEFLVTKSEKEHRLNSLSSGEYRDILRVGGSSDNGWLSIDLPIDYRGNFRVGDKIILTLEVVKE